jgi:O-methyltransferase
MKIKEDFSAELFKFYKKSIENLKQLSYSNNKFGYSHNIIIPNSSYSPWQDDEVFLNIYNQIKSHTLVDVYRCYSLYSFVKRNNNLKGDILEVGVWRGGTGALLSNALFFEDKNAKIYLADTFAGVVKASDNDTNYIGGEHSDTSKDIVLNLLKEFETYNYEILSGVFPDEVDLPSNIQKLRLCHIDVDTYESALGVFNRVWDNIEEGGAVIFDDYGFWGCEGIAKLCNELVVKNATFFYNLNGQAIFVKNSNSSK